MRYINCAEAKIEGGDKYPSIHGTVKMTDVFNGTRVEAQIFGLPDFSRENGKTLGPFGFHIHTGQNLQNDRLYTKEYLYSDSCGSGDSPFSKAGGHFNPDGSEYGNETGQFPVLIAQEGRAIMTFITSRFKVYDIIGLPVVIHEQPDDFRTSPTGNSGERIACGILVPC